MATWGFGLRAKSMLALLLACLLAALGPQQSRRRGAGLVVYIVFLICLIITVVPLGALLKKLLAPLSRDRTLREKAYFAGPSGE